MSVEGLKLNNNPEKVLEIAMNCFEHDRCVGCPHQGTDECFITLVEVAGIEIVAETMVQMFLHGAKCQREDVQKVVEIADRVLKG